MIVLEMAERGRNLAKVGLDYTKLVRCWEKDCIDWLISEQGMFSIKHLTDAGILDININIRTSQFGLGRSKLVVRLVTLK